MVRSSDNGTCRRIYTYFFRFFFSANRSICRRLGSVNSKMLFFSAVSFIFIFIFVRSAITIENCERAADRTIYLATQLNRGSLRRSTAFDGDCRSKGNFQSSLKSRKNRSESDKNREKERIFIRGERPMRGND